jgi:hypothetical protein
MHRVRQTTQQAENEEQETDRISMPQARQIVDATGSDRVHVERLMFMSDSLRGDVKQRTNLERLMCASAPSEVGGSPCARSLLWHYHNGARNL